MIEFLVKGSLTSKILQHKLIRFNICVIHIGFTYTVLSFVIFRDGCSIWVVGVLHLFQLSHTDLHSYFGIWDQLAATNGLIFRGQRLVTPISMRAEVKDIHTRHVDIEGCLHRARELVYWPGMNAEVKAWIQTCEACREHEISQPSESLMSHELPNRHWEKIGLGLLTYKEKDNVICSDYKTNFWEIDYLPKTNVTTVIAKIKAHFARYGIPDTVVSDNGPSFNSDTFAHFAQKWEFEHNPSSPYHSRSNGKARSAVKSAKKMLRKAKRNGDQYHWLGHPSKILFSWVATSALI